VLHIWFCAQKILQQFAAESFERKTKYATPGAKGLTIFFPFEVITKQGFLMISGGVKFK